MSNCKLSMSRVNKAGQPAIMISMYWAPAELHAVCENLGMTQDCTISNMQSIVTNDHAQIASIQAALRPLFDNSGAYVG